VDYFFETARGEGTPIYWQTPAVAGVIPGYFVDKPAKRGWRAFDLPLSINKFNFNALTLTWNISDSFTIKSLTSYRDSSNDIYADLAESFSSPLGGGAGTSFFVQDHYVSHQFTQ